MANGFNLENIGLALSGLSAGIAGQGAQFAQGLQQNREREAQRQEILSQERQSAQFTDARVGLDLLKSGQLDEFMKFGAERVGAIDQLGGDPEDTLTVMTLVRQGKAQEAINLLQNADNEGVTRGFLNQREQPRRKVLETKDGRVTFLNTDGSVSEEAVQGAIVKAEEGKGDDFIKLGDLRSINKDVGDLIKEPSKIRNSAARLEKISKTKSATDQLAAIFTFMRALDPTSVVRESEQDQARATGGVADVMVGFVNKIQGEGALPPAVFDNMVLTAKRLSNQAISDVKTEVDGFLGAFGDRLKPKAKSDLSRRIPKLFEMPKESPATSGVPDALLRPSSQSATPAVPLSIGRFTVEVN